MRGVKRTTEQFIIDSKKVHGDKYDYSKVKYINGSSKVCIICPIHGEFLQTPEEHLKGSGCNKCAKNVRRKTTKQFIIEAQEVHGNKYDYSKVEYLNNKTKVCIICPEHGEFWQAPIKHLMSGNGCPLCSKSKKGKQVNIVSFTDTTNYKNEFIKKSSLIHNNKYDYSKVEYINENKKVCIICPEHGEFWQAPHYHKIGRGCPKCGRKIITTDTYIEFAKKRHGDKYDYSKIKYVNNKSPIIVICPEHGEFSISPTVFLRKNGTHCPLCRTYKNIMENKLYDELVKKYNNIKIIKNYRNYKLLKRKEIDIYIPKLKIGIEYQGKQHFTPIDFFGGEIAFKKQIQRDIEKIEDCNKNGIKLLHFSYDNNPPQNLNYKIYNNINDIFKIINETMN